MASVGPRIHMPGVTLGRFCLVGRSQKCIQCGDRDGLNESSESGGRGVSVRRDRPEVRS